MRYTALPSIEAKFLQTVNNGKCGFQKVSGPVPGESLHMNALFATPAGRSDYYYAVAHLKQRIALHFTAGNIRSNMGALTRNDCHVSVPFVIARDGAICQLFSSKYWPGGIGKGIGKLHGNAQDMGAAFDWAEVIAGVQAPLYQTMVSSEAVVERALEAGPVVASEEALADIAPTPKGASLEDEPYDEAAPGEAQKNLKKKKVYALVVGIDDYPKTVVLEGRVSFPPLRGCVADAQKIAAYLQSDKDLHVDLQLLTNAEASKEAIVAAFKNHLGRAAKGDAVLFYFSGHGTQEHADKKLWTSDTDGRLECIACYYDKHSANAFLLADKELRFLIGKVAQRGAHVAALFDCCHSGDNTRNGEMVTTVFKDAVEKRVPFAFAKRPFEDFVFAGEISYNDILQKGEAVALAEGPHVQLSACESDESAVEVSGEGVFTKTLIQVLEASGGALTYTELRSRIRQYLRNVYEQKPRLYTTENAGAMQHRYFLGKKRARPAVMGEIVHNSVDGWLLNRGAVHGLDKNTLAYLTDEDGNEVAASIGRIKIDHAEVLLRGELNTAKAYKVRLEGLRRATLPLHVANTNGLPEDQQALMQVIFDKAKSYIVPEETESKAAYTLHNRNGVYYFTKPDDAFRPLAAPVSSISDDAAGIIATQARHISQWAFLKDLENESAETRLPQHALHIELFQIASTEALPIDVNEERATIELSQKGNGYRAQISIRLTNTTDRNIYCCALYLTSRFEAYAGMLQPQVYLLGPGEAVSLKVKDKELLPVVMDEVYQWYNWPYWEDHFKILYSTGEFDASALSLEALPKPPVPGERGSNKKSIAFAEREEEVTLSGWATQLLTLRFQNPAFNQISSEALSQMLKFEATADFALGLYFNPVVEALAVRYELKEEIQLSGSEALQKGLVQEKAIDLANWWARRRRNNQYRQMIQRFPQRMRIVSEGDSWFQHPLVVDTIDHLSRMYPVYCVAAAADTLRNYVSATKKAGEFYLDAIEEQQPDVFLISGGGNDILGKQFRGYLNAYTNDGLPEGAQPERFLKSAFFDELKSLQEIYRALFADLQTNKPDLKILVHGYDYPVKLDDPQKGWLGRYMIEQGIRAGDRRAIIRHIIDAFNAMLLELAVAFDNITYIDIRNTVRYDPVNGPDQWYDEIHPNNEGFQQVAMKFLSAINSIAVKKKGKPNAPIRERPWITINTKNVAYERDSFKDLDDVFAYSGRGTVAQKKPSSGEEPESAGNEPPQSAPPPSSLPSAPAPLPPAAGSGIVARSSVRPGHLDYTIPGTMQVRKPYRCKVKIAGLEVSKADLKTSAGSNYEMVQIAERMSVCLIDVSGGKSFEITDLSMRRQLILPGEATTWSFTVTPLRQGFHALALRVTIHIKGGDKDLDVLEKEVVVTTDAGGEPAAGAIDRVLYLSASPVDMEALNLTKELAWIQEELKGAADRKMVFTINPAVTPDSLIDYLSETEPADIIHFSGHGSEAGICIEEEDGRAKLVDNLALEVLFESVKNGVRCVVLNTCYSEAQARAIVKHIPYVVAMKRSVKDKASRAFSKGFYTAIGNGKDIKTAFTLGLVRMRLELPGQDDIPVLLEKGAP